MRGGAAWLTLIGTLAAAGPACKRPSDPLARAAELELFSWWTAEGERQALEALLNAHRARRPDVQIANIAVPNKSVDPERVLNWRMGLDDRGLPDRRIVPHPPSLVQWDLYDVSGRWLNKGVHFIPLDDLFKSAGLPGKLYDFLARDLRQNDQAGHYLGLPIGLHRENSLIFDRRALRELGIAESSLRSWDGFLAACETVKRAGRTCLALTQESWVNAIVFRAVAAATMGREKFRAFFGRQGDRNDPALVTAVQSYKALFDRGYVGGWDNQRRRFVDQRGWAHVRPEGWAEAARDVHRGQAVFFIHGDWSVGVCRALGWTAEQLGVAPAPGTEGLFLVGVDGFLIPEGADNRDLAMDVLRTWTQPSTLAAYNFAKGSTPPRPDIDLSADPLATTARDLAKAAVVMTPPIFLPADTDLLRHAAGDETLEQAVNALRAALYPAPAPP
jgi:glucose/mannose transport system substrate-binding protein